MSDIVDQLLVALPIRSFSTALRRLDARLDTDARAKLARALAGHTADVVLNSGADPVIVSSSPDVASWASERGLRQMAEPPVGGLNAAAGAVAQAAPRSPWIVLHADLPCLTPSDLLGAYTALSQSTGVLAPSYDGGTSVVGGRGAFDFNYGPASFHRHRRAAPDHRVLVSLGFLLDVDHPTDLQAACNHPQGAWLQDHLEAR